MTKAAARPASPPIAIPVREILPWLIFGALMLLLLYFVGIEEGAISIIPGMWCMSSPMTAAICSASPATKPGGHSPW